MVSSTALREPPESATRKTAANNQEARGKTTACLQTSPKCPPDGKGKRYNWAVLTRLGPHAPETNQPNSQESTAKTAREKNNGLPANVP